MLAVKGHWSPDTTIWSFKCKKKINCSHPCIQQILDFNIYFDINKLPNVSAMTPAILVKGIIIHNHHHHCCDVIMGAMASQITSLMNAYSTINSGTDQRKHQSSVSLAFVWEFTGDQWIPRTNGQSHGKCFQLMTSSWLCLLLLDSRHWSFMHIVVSTAMDNLYNFLPPIHVIICYIGLYYREHWLWDETMNHKYVFDTIGN